MEREVLKKVVLLAALYAESMVKGTAWPMGPPW